MTCVLILISNQLVTDVKNYALSILEVPYNKKRKYSLLSIARGEFPGHPKTVKQRGKGVNKGRCLKDGIIFKVGSYPSGRYSLLKERNLSIT